MTTTLTIAAHAYTPRSFLAYDLEADGRNIYDTLLDDTEVVQERAGGPSVGTWRAVFDDAHVDDAHALYLDILTGAELELEDTDRPHINMTCRLDGKASLRLDQRTFQDWVVSWDYRETT